jgi:molecular chaperone GrpE
MSKKKKDKNLQEEHNIQEQTAGDGESSEEKSLEEQYSQVCLEMERLKEDKLRALAEAENFKKRLTREKEDFCRFATSRVLEDMLPVMDNLELALQHKSADKSCQGLIQGVQMTLNIFLETLKRHGLERVAETNVPFDPARHEAMGRQETADMAPDHVAAVLQPGYILNGRLLRPARVMVSAEDGNAKKK